MKSRHARAGKAPPPLGHGHFIRIEFVDKVVIEPALSSQEYDPGTQDVGGWGGGGTADALEFFGLFVRQGNLRGNAWHLPESVD